MSVIGRTATLLLLLAPTPALAVDPIAQFHLGPNSAVTTKVSLTGGVVYPTRISGFEIVKLPGSSKDVPTSTQYEDAFSCYDNSKEGAHSLDCRHDDVGDVVSLTARTGETTTQHPLQEFVPDGEPVSFHPSWMHPPFRADHDYDTFRYRPALDGKLVLATSEECAGFKCSGPGFDVRIFPPEGTCDEARRVTARAAANQARVIAVQPDVEIHRANTPDECFIPAAVDDVVQQGDTISTDPEGSVTLQFPSGETAVIGDSTTIGISQFFAKGGVDEVVFRLKMGRIVARVPLPFVPKSDFHYQPPNLAVASVRGRRSVHSARSRAAGDFVVSVYYDPGSKTSVVSVLGGKVSADNLKGTKRTLSSGQEAVVAKRSFMVGKLGTVGARGGVTIAEATDAVMKVVAKGLGPCTSTIPRQNAYSVKPAKGGWTVLVKIDLRGASKWTVKGSRVIANNALAKRLKRGCH